MFQNIRDMFQGFSRTSSMSEKIVVVLAAIVGYIILVYTSMILIGWLINMYESRIELISGLKSAKEMSIITQDPTNKASKPIFRSVDKSGGIEFTWSTWIYIEDLMYNSGKYKCIFYKGNDNIGDNGLNTPNNAPGLYIAPNTNELVVFMNTFSAINEQINIPNIPTHKWVHVLIRCENQQLDVYINGMVAKSHKLNGVPKQNYGNVYVNTNGGFDGSISDLYYYNSALGINQINSIVKSGPNLKVNRLNNISNKNSSYLSMRWYL